MEKEAFKLEDYIDLDNPWTVGLGGAALGSLVGGISTGPDVGEKKGDRLRRTIRNAVLGGVVGGGGLLGLKYGMGAVEGGLMGDRKTNPDGTPDNGTIFGSSPFGRAVFGLSPIALANWWARKRSMPKILATLNLNQPGALAQIVREEKAGTRTTLKNVKALLSAAAGSPAAPADLAGQTKAVKALEHWAEAGWLKRLLNPMAVASGKPLYEGFGGWMRGLRGLAVPAALAAFGPELTDKAMRKVRSGSESYVLGPLIHSGIMDSPSGSSSEGQDEEKGYVGRLGDWMFTPSKR